jgi:vitamin B12 transporter
LLSHGLKLAALASLAVRVGFVSAAAHADDAAKKSNELGTIIVTGSQLPSDTKTTGSSVTVIGEQEIEDGQYRNALGALQQVPGLDIVQSGGFGGNAAVFLRGGNSEGTLVLLDGIELNNPATPNRSYNMANLTLENIERVEVIRGPQSTIYGSDAMGGVINLVSKKAKRVFTPRLPQRRARIIPSLRWATSLTEVRGSMSLLGLLVKISVASQPRTPPMEIVSTMDMRIPR